MRKFRFLTGFIFLIFIGAFHLDLGADCWKRIYLASYPQGGNHWVRFMVEEASGIVTSSVYKDFEPPGHMDKVFPWGGFCCDHGYTGECRYPTCKDIVLLKTHYPYPHKDSPYDGLSHLMVIRIVRNPVDTFVSRYTKVPKGSVQAKVPSERIKELIKTWRDFQVFWNKKKNVLTLRYEDLLQDPRAGLKKICEALKYEVTDEDIERAIAKYPPEGYEYKHISRIKKSDLKIIARELSPLLEQFHYEIPL